MTSHTFATRSASEGQAPTPTVRTGSGHHRPDRPVRPAFGNPMPMLLIFLTLVGQALVYTDVQIPVLRPAVALAVLVFVPALVITSWLLRTSRGLEPAPVICLGLSASLLGVIAVALIMNFALPWMGVSRPLARVPLVTVSSIIDVALLWSSRRYLPSPTDLRTGTRQILALRLDPAVAIAIVAFLAAIAGVYRLDNGIGGSVAVIGHLLVIAALAVAIWTPSTLSRDALVVWLASAALLLATSLRSGYLIGHDIQREYEVFSLAARNGVWDPGALNTAYNACLSVTLLPTTLAEFTGLDGRGVFCIVMQLFASLTPVLLLCVARRYLSPALALIAVLFFLSFPTFSVDLPYLTRQGIAYLFLASVMAVASISSWSRRRRRRWIIVFGVGIVLSHYSTTYLLLIALVIAFGLKVAGWLIAVLRRRRPGLSGLRGVLVDPLVIAVLAASSMIWTGPVTNSGGHFAETASGALASLVGKGDAVSSSDLAYGLLAGAQPSPEERMDKYVADAEVVRRTNPDVERVIPDDVAEPTTRVLSPESTKVRKPTMIEPKPQELTGFGRALEGIGLNVQTAQQLMRTGAAAALQLFLVVGLAVVVLRRRRIGSEMRLLAIGGVGALGVVVVIPGLSAEYGVLRAFQQTMIMVLPIFAIGAAWLFKWCRRWQPVVVTCVAVAISVVLLGPAAALTGGGQPILSQANAGLYYDLYYQRGSEIRTKDWMGRTAASAGSAITADGRGSGAERSQITTDRSAVSRTRTAMPAGVPVFDELNPMLLRRDSYVLLTRQTVDKGQASVFWTGDILIYKYPVELLDDRLNLIFSSDGAAVYR